MEQIQNEGIEQTNTQREWGHSNCCHCEKISHFDRFVFSLVSTTTLFPKKLGRHVNENRML